MPNVDNRVVEMRFDNKDFQTGVSESISSLDKLKRSLNLKDAADGFDEIGRAAESVTHKFSALGTIGDQILRDIGNEVYSLKNKFVDLIKSMSVDQITAGWNKYGEKTASVQTILNATGKSIDEVNTYLDRLMTYSDETSFGFTDMTSALQTMTAAGGDLEKLIPMLIGMGNAVAFAGKGPAEFKRVMAYGLNQAYGLDYLGSKDWMSFQGAGVNSKQLQQTFIDIVNAKNKAQYELKDFSTLLTKKLITKDVMEDALGRFAEVTLEAEKLINKGMFETFSEAYEYLGTTDFASLYDGVAYRAAKAAQEAKTFVEAIDATKDAVSSGWMKTFEQLFGNYEEAKVNWTWLANELWEVFASGAQGRNEMLQAWHEEGYEKLWDSIKNIWYGLRSFGGRIKEAWLTIFPSLDTQKLLEITDKFHNFSIRFRQALDPAFEVVDKAVTTFERGGKLFTTIFGAGDVEIAQENVDELNSVVSTGNDLLDRYIRTLEIIDELESRVWQGKYGIGQDRRDQLEEEGYAYELVQNAVNETAGCYARLEVDEEALAEAQGILDGTIERTVENTEEAADATEELANASKKARNWVSDLRDVLYGFKSAFDLLVEGGKAVAKVILIPAWNFLVEVFKKLLGVIAPFSRAFTDFVNKVKETHAIENGLKALGQWFSSLYDNLKEKENFKKFLGYLQEFKAWIIGIKDQALDKVTGFFDKLASMDIELPDTDKIATWVDQAFGWIDGVIEKIHEVDGWWPKIKTFFEGLDFSNVTEFAKSAAGGVSTFFQTLFADKDLGEASSGWIDQLLSGIKKKLSEVNWGELIEIALKSLGGAMIFKLANSLANLFGAGSDVLDNFAKRISKLFKGITNAFNATATLEVALAIVALAGAMLMLSKVPTDKLPIIAVDLSIVILALAALAKVLGKTKLIGDRVNNLKFRAKINVFSQLGTTLVGFAIAIGAIIAALVTINKIKKDGGNVMDAVNTLAWVFVIFAAFAAIIKVLTSFGTASSNKNFGKNIMQTAIAFAILGVAINIMAPGIKALTEIPFLRYNFWPVFGLLVTLFGGLALVAVAAKTDMFTKSNIFKAALAFVAFAAAIRILIPGIESLINSIRGNTNLKSFRNIIISIIALMASFSIAVRLLGKMSNVELRNGLIALLGVSAGIIAVSGALRIIEGLKWDQIKTGVLVIGGIALAFLALSAVAGFLRPIGIGMEAVGIGFAAFGAGVALVGIGAKKFAEAMAIIADSSIDAKEAGKNLAQGVTGFFEELVKNGKPIIEFFTMLINAIIAVLVLKKADIVDLGSGIVTAFGTRLKSVIGSSGAFLLVAASVLIGAVLEYFGIHVGDVTDYLIKATALVIEGLAKALISNAGIIASAMKDLFDALGITASKAIMQFQAPFTDFFNNLGDFLLFPKQITYDKETGNWIEKGLGDLLFGNAAQNLDAWETRASNYANAHYKLLEFAMNKQTDQFVSDITGSSGKVSNAINNLWSSFFSGKSNDPGFEHELTLTYQRQRKKAEEIALAGYADVDPNMVKDVERYGVENGKAYGSAIIDSMLSYFKDQGASPEQIMTFFNEGLVKGGNESFGSVLDMTEDEARAAIDSFMTNWGEHSPSKEAEKLTRWFNIGLVNGFSGSSSKVLNKAITLADDILKTFKEIGQDAIQGFINGMNDYLNIVEITSENVGHVAVRGLKKSIKSNSPSKEFGKLGKYSAQGYANELASNTYLAEDAATSLGEDTLSAFNSVISRIYDAINGDFDMNPVIRPVLDLSEIQNGQGRIASVLGTRNYSMSPNMQYSMIHANNVMASVNSDGLAAEVRALREEVRQFKAEQNRYDISSAVRGIRSEVSDFKESLGRMRVVLDDGTLVGHIDSALGQRTKLARRGV